MPISDSCQCGGPASPGGGWDGCTVDPPDTVPDLSFIRGAINRDSEEFSSMFDQMWGDWLRTRMDDPGDGVPAFNAAPDPRLLSPGQRLSLPRARARFESTLADRDLVGVGCE